MELWIRSQDKLLLRKPRQIKIYEDTDDWIVGETLVIDYGKYKTKERALEVLDEIQELLKPKILIYKGKRLNYNEAKVMVDILNYDNIIMLSDDNAKLEQLGVLVYEMPEE